MKRTSSEAVLRAVLAMGSFALAGCGGGVDRTVVVHEPAPIQEPAEEVVTTEEPAPEVVVQEENEPVVVERVVEVERQDPVIHIQIEREYFARHPHHQRLNGVAAVNFNNGYLDGWAGAQFFNHGKPLADDQVDRMIEMGRRQGDPTGKLSLAGYQEGYRAGAQHERNPYQRRMTAEQATRYRTLTGAAPEGRREPGSNVGATGRVGATPSVGTTPRVGTAETEAARKARLEASRNNLEAARNNREAEQKKLETARLEREAARKAELEASKAKREQQQLAMKQKLEAEKKQREAEREQREVALKAKLQAEKEEREAKKDQRTANLDKRAAERKQKLVDRKSEREQKLAQKKAERDAKNSQTADTSEAVK